METTMKIQFYIFLTSIYGGLIAGLVFDFYRVIRHYSKPKKIVTGVGDLLFCIGIALVFFYIINKSNWGQLRGYIFVGFFLGGFLYLKVLSKILHPLLLKLFDGISFILRWTFHIIRLPFKAANRIIAPKVRKVNKLRRIPREAISEIRRYRRIISKKK